MPELTPGLLVASGVTVLGLLLLLVAISGGRASSDLLGGIDSYGEPGWGQVPGRGGEGPHLADTEMVQFEGASKSPITRVIANYRDSRRKQAQKRVGAVQSPMARRLALGRIPLGPSEWFLVRIGVCGIVGGLAYLKTHSPYMAAAIGVIGGFMGTKIYLGMRVNKRQTKFEKQLLEVMSVISAGMRAGSTFVQALEYVAGHVEAPAGPEFARLSREAQLGVPMDECLYHLAERNESNELRLLVNALVVNRRVGGNLTSILEILGDTIRMRIKIKGDIKTLTAQARASAWIVSILPLALLGILSVISPAYVGPLFSNGIGIGILVAGGVMMLLGMAIMRVITKVDV